MDNYFNTTNETGDQLKEYTLKAGSQAAMILDYFRNHPGEEFTPWEVHLKAFAESKDPNIFDNPIITSVRRSMTVLTNHGFLEKTQNKKTGVYGRPCYTWKLCAPWLDKIYTKEQQDLIQKLDQAHEDTQMDLFKTLGYAMKDGLSMEEEINRVFNIKNKDNE